MVKKILIAETIEKLTAVIKNNLTKTCLLKSIKRKFSNNNYQLIPEIKRKNLNYVYLHRDKIDTTLGEPSFQVSHAKRNDCGSCW